MRNNIQSIRFLKHPLGWIQIGLGALFGLGGTAMGASGFVPQGTEYPIAGLLAGDQTHPEVSLAAQGGYLVWVSNSADGDGLGVSARRVDGNLTGSLSSFLVNQTTGGDQTQATVKLLQNGGAVFAWNNNGKIAVRFLGSDGTFLTSEIALTDSSSLENDPDIAVLTDGTVLVVWGAEGVDGSRQGVLGQLISPSGNKLGSPFLVNLTSDLNQRNPKAAALSQNRFAVVWISERGALSSGNVEANLMGRIFSLAGESLTGENEIKLNDSNAYCMDPEICSLEDGFAAVWVEKTKATAVSQQVFVNGEASASWVVPLDDTQVDRNSLDIVVRSYSNEGQAKGGSMKVNTYIDGIQYAPSIASLGETCLVIWDSIWQDGSHDGVFGQFIAGDGSLDGSEFQVNGRSASKQMTPVVASNGVGQFLVVWSTFVGGYGSFELFAQRYYQTAPKVKPEAPFFYAISPNKLRAVWPEASGLNVESYLVYVDSASEALQTSRTDWVVEGLIPGSLHQVSLAYLFQDGTKSLPSNPASAKTWGADDNFDGLPDDWQTTYWGTDSRLWPDRLTDSDLDGASNLAELLAGTDPRDAQSVLRAQVQSTSQGLRLHWNSQPGFIYQVQIKSDLSAAWVDIGEPRFSLDTVDSIPLPEVNDVLYFRVKRVR